MHVTSLYSFSKESEVFEEILIRFFEKFAKTRCLINSEMILNSHQKNVRDIEK